VTKIAQFPIEPHVRAGPLVIGADRIAIRSMSCSSAKNQADVTPVGTWGVGARMLLNVLTITRAFKRSSS
jgi:hypothetical protein